MDTYFVRHTATLDIDQATRDHLWKRRLIAIHFPNPTGLKWPKRDSESTDPRDYKKSGRGAMRALRTLADNGGYVYAEYYGQSKALIGMVKRGTTVSLMRGTWGDRNGNAGRTAILKTLQLRNVRVLPAWKTVSLSSARPRQGTIMRWRQIKQRVENLVRRRQVPPVLDHLSHDQQELMCAEFLRSPAARRLGLPRLSRLLQPVGRTLRDIDIAGLTPTGSRIYAQVTFRDQKDAEQKERRLRKYKHRGLSLVFFCNCERASHENGFHRVPLEVVYREFCKGRLGREWVKAAAQG